MRRLLILFGLTLATMRMHAQAFADLPDEPGAALFSAQNAVATSVSNVPCTPANAPPPSPTRNNKQPVTVPGMSLPPSCAAPDDLYTRFANTPAITPMTVKQKGRLAMHDIVDPFNLLTIAFTSAVSTAIDSHSAYGPGMRGFGYNAGISLVQDATGEVIGTFAIASITHEDPRYHRMPNASIKRRLWHAIEHSYVSQHDNGRPMPNYEVLLTYPICAELSNLYVPGIADDRNSTIARVGIGLATNPADDLVAEFLPDVASHLHLRVVFIQRIVNRIATGQSTSP